ncbi:MAG: adenylate/guanylate cyclase domain-containing protein [Flavobacteriales bacterium]|nr:adenylate/guanylate cyclase domain-containing protein [Flavobacteriales bacterium]
MSRLMTDMTGTIAKYFIEIPPVISFRNYRFYLVGNVAYNFALFVHSLWAVLFGVLGVTQLMYFNLGSVAIFIACIVLNRRGIHMFPTIIGVGEVIAHQVYACHLLGVDSGYQLYILVVSLFPFIMPAWRPWIKALLFLFSLAGYLAIEAVLKGVPPVVRLDPSLLYALNISNICFGFICLAIWGIYFNFAVYRTEEKLDAELDKSEQLLLNILPGPIAAELKETGAAEARDFERATILFTDFKDFTRHSEVLSARELVDEINACFKEFDRIITDHGVEKIKTIGDSYMAVGGVPQPGIGSPSKVVHAALAMQAFMVERKKRRLSENLHAFEMRVGIHTGPVVAGIVGVKKFQYDIWGDTVNTASRMESSGEVGQVNISEATYQLVKNEPGLTFTPRGKVQAKGKGEMEMYFAACA